MAPQGHGRCRTLHQGCYWRDFSPGFMVEHFLKDMDIALDEAHAMNLATPGLALARELYASLSAQGSGRDGTQALVRATARLSGTEW